MNLKVIIAIFLILAIGGAFYISLQKDTDVLIVEVTLARPPDDNPAKIVSKVTASLSTARKMEVPDETPLEPPGITVLVMQNKQLKSNWYSVPLHRDDKGNYIIYGNYTIKVKFSDVIDKSQPVSILTKVINPAGKEQTSVSTTVMLQ